MKPDPFPSAAEVTVNTGNAMTGAAAGAGTQATSIDGDNPSAYRQRVERVRDDGG